MNLSLQDKPRSNQMADSWFPTAVISHFYSAVYTGSHSKTIVFGLITLDREGFFQRYDSFTGKEFVEFLKAACERFGKILMITDGAPQHRSKFVREEIGRLGGVELQFLPPGSERDRGGVAPDETRGPGRAVRPVQLHVQRHRQVAEVVPAKT